MTNNSKRQLQFPERRIHICCDWEKCYTGHVAFYLSKKIRMCKKLDWYRQADKESKGIWLKCAGYYHYKSQKDILLKILRSGRRKINE